MGNTTIAVLEEVTQVVEIVLPGPQGPVGDIHPSMPGLVQQATDAATSATASALSADTSEANASASAAAALASKDAAAASEASALASKNAAATSATSASGSATTATTKASEASTSATNAADSATAAATSATDTANALVGERSAVATLTNKTITSPVIDSGAANGVTYLTGSKVLTAGSGLTYNGSALQINAESYPSLKLGNAAGVSKGELYFGVGGDDLNLVSYVAGPIVFKSGNAEQMRLTSTGLGIGTSSPAYKLDVLGNARIQSTNYADAVLRIAQGPATTGNTSQILFQDQGDNTTASISAFGTAFGSGLNGAFRIGTVGGSAILDASGNLGLGVVPSAWNASYKTIQIGSIGSVSGTNSAAYIGQNWYQDAAGQNRYITTGIAASFGSDATGTHIWYKAPSGAAGSPISFTQAMTLFASGGLALGVTTDPGNGVGSFNGVRIGANGSDIDSTYNGASSVLSFRINSTEYARIDASGNLGLGTSSPLSKLHVTGDVRATGNLILVGGAGTPEVQFFQSSRNWKIRNNAGSLEVYDSTASAVRATFNASGNLGLGVTPSAWGSNYKALQINSGGAGIASTSRNLLVAGNAYNDNAAWKYVAGAPAAMYNCNGLGGQHEWHVAPSGTAGDPISFTQVMTLDANGRLGVGTSSPNANLDVAAVNPTARINAISGGIPTLSLFSNGVYDWRISGGTALSFVRDATTVATLDASGNLGIGTSSPAARIVTAHTASGNTAMASVDSWSDDFQTSRSGFGFNACIDHAAYSQAAVRLDATKSGWLIQGRNAPGAEAAYDWLTVSRVDTSGVSTKMLNLDASGNLGLGVTPRAWYAPHYAAMQLGDTGSYLLSGKATLSGDQYFYMGNNGSMNAVGNWTYTRARPAARYLQFNDEHRWSSAAGGAAGDPLAFTQTMTLNASGNLLVGTTSSVGARIQVVGAGTVGAFDRTGTDGTNLAFLKAGTVVGTISVTDSATAYNTSSDYRLKDITGPVANSGAYIDSLNPVEGSWKADGSTFVGLIAHEVQEASRTQVATGVKDGEEMQAMDYSASELIANMIAELKSLRARVAALESI